jgi:hypothetical protein
VQQNDSERQGAGSAECSRPMPAHTLLVLAWRQLQCRHCGHGLLICAYNPCFCKKHWGRVPLKAKTNE